MQIHLLHVNDVHSQLENYMRLGHRLRELRTYLTEQGEAVITFDLGDLMDRVRPETEASMGILNADLLATLGVDGWVFGNNEGLTIPVSDWASVCNHAHTVVFGTNLKQQNGTDFPFFEDFHIYTVQGVRVGAFGVSPNYTLPYEMLGVCPEDPYERATQTVASLKALQCDVIVCLSHLGRRADHRLAETVDGIDVILGGHTHEFMKEADWVNNTAIFQPGKHARVFGHTILTLDTQNRVANVVSRPVEVPLTTPADEAMLECYGKALPHLEESLNYVVGRTEYPLAMEYDRESLFANLLADVLFDSCEGDFSLMMTGALNASIRPGPITLNALLSACPTPTRPLVLGLTGREILEVLNHGIQPSTYSRHGIGFGFRGGQIGYLVVSGAEITVKEDTQRQRSVSQVEIQGNPLELESVYRVITCEYLWLSPVFSAFKNARDITYQQPLVRELLLQRIHDKGRIERAQIPRYRYQTATTV